MIKIKLVNDRAKVPERANPTDAGADLFATENCIILPMDNYFMDFGFQMEIPEGYCGMIFARSGLGSKKGIRPRNCVGIIDSKYRGNVGMMIENHNIQHVIIHEGDRIAQLVIVPIGYSPFVEVAELDMENDRNGGFGSSGK